MSTKTPKAVKETAFNDYKSWTCKNCEKTILAPERPNYCLHCGETFMPPKSLNEYSWEEIKAILAQGNAGEYFNIGDEKKVVLYTGEVVKVKLINLYGAEKTDGNESVLATFMFYIDGEYEMNETFTNNGGWRDSKMRTVYMPRFLRLLPDGLQKVIKTVEKETSIGNGSTDLCATDDKLFLPSEVEITGEKKFSAKGEGKQYEWFKKNTLPSKWIWLRSPNPAGSFSFAFWAANGCVTYSIASSAFRVALCFCL